MPKPWVELVGEHRRETHEAILDATAALVHERGLDTVTMAAIAEQAGIPEARLARHFPDVDAVLQAWHQRQIGQHLAYLGETGDQPGTPIERLAAVLRSYAVLAHQAHRQHSAKSAAVLHRGEHMAEAQDHLHGMIRDLLAECARNGDIRDDVTPDELASYCTHALTAASGHTSTEAIRRLVTVTLDGLRKP
ncbi:TetR/AcrR family transcriptional regulator [Actinophytocola sp.]|uniref:TetR/AcrR family transcriptional regulator n=1 Tax=Actinophytocola sp. TaxID=1872138 RepID=UPI002D8067E9|nr:TetR/AcrR family transcriptional regulator [Actinophytocola sp.]HET9141633.1 TetR/AcrR family transcriptional regulator [Actinophytocola sp.]